MLIHQLKIHFFSQYSSFLITQQKSKNQKKVNNHYVVTQTSSALQITQQKCFSWAPVKVLTRRPWYVSKSFTMNLSHFGCQRKLYFLSNCQKVLAFEALRDLACGKPPSQEIFSLGNITWNDEVPLFVTFVFDIRSNESFLHNRKRPDRIGKCSIPGG